MGRLQTWVVLLCAATLCLHVAFLYHRLAGEARTGGARAGGQRLARRDALLPGPASRGLRFRRGKLRLPAARRGVTEAGASDVGRASMWSKRLAYSPAPPAGARLTGENAWVAETGGLCLRRSGETAMPTFAPTPAGAANATDVSRSVLRRVREFEAARVGARRLAGVDFWNDVPFRVPRGCATLVRRRKRFGNGAGDDGASAGDAEPDEARGAVDNGAVGYCDAVACLPNIFLIGASKAGTTTLAEALVAHPRVVRMKAEPHTHGETHVFTEPVNAPAESAARAFRRVRPVGRERLAELRPEGDGPWDLSKSAGGPVYVLEYTPHYLVLPDARDRICAALSLGGLPCEAAKFVVLLRDPAKRAFSQWVMKTHMRVIAYNERRTFDQVVFAGKMRTERYAACWDAALQRPAGASAANASAFVERILGHPARILEVAAECPPKKFDGNLFQAYVLKSAYFYQLLPWFATAPGNIHVSLLERFGPDELRTVPETGVLWAPRAGRNAPKPV
ncbi:P-loop containing nucleoside triphosphate hydrolase protein [Pelagophyceae sp. CCMP2097]|nr:P-loop containing nucleoside triphosphate hydrolase protein [Pelagophyceae sp. CCMP2097]